jgi:hypothetical protein
MLPVLMLLCRRSNLLIRDLLQHLIVAFLLDIELLLGNLNTRVTVLVTRTA